MKNTLYVGNLALETTAQSLDAAFRSSGDVTDVTIVTDRETGRSRGFGFVVMSTSGQARQARRCMNGAVVDGRMLHVNAVEDLEEWQRTVER